MILPIVAFGAPILRKKCKNISADYADLSDLLSNMCETMHEANGVGLAAPQINKSIKLFLVDTTSFKDDDEISNNQIIKKVFINPSIIKESGKEWSYKEGCLSIPEIREDVIRNSTINISYFDENFKQHIDVFDGIVARVIQHEYDHINGVLFVDRISPLRKRMIKGKLKDIVKGYLKVSYKMRA